MLGSTDTVVWNSVLLLRRFISSYPYHSLPSNLLLPSGPQGPHLMDAPKEDLRGPPSTWGPYFGHHIVKCKQANFPHRHLGISPILSLPPTFTPRKIQGCSLVSFLNATGLPSAHTGFGLPALDLFTPASRPCPRSGEGPACKKGRSRSLAFGWRLPHIVLPISLHTYFARSLVTSKL